MTLLSRTRAAFGQAPRSLSKLDTPTPPAWMSPADELRLFYSRYRELLETGDIVWGHVIQANSVLFRPGNEVAPASVVFASSDREALPDRLHHTAGAAFALKGKKLADPALALVGETLAAEMRRHPAIELPPAVTHGIPMRMGLVVIHREFLPCRYLATLAVPLVVNPARDFVTVLPARFWTEDLVRGWLALGTIAA